MNPATNWKEEIPADEAQQLEELAKIFVSHQKQFARDGKTPRAAHAKGVLGVKARFTVLPDLPEHARVGIFATPGSYEGWVRFSNSAFGFQSDHSPDIRGLAVKLLGVPGKKIIPGMENATTQDFLLINTPRFFLRTADEFVFFGKAAMNPVTLLPKAFARLGVVRTIKILRNFARTGKPLASVAGQRFWSLVPIGWGPYAAKVTLIPVQPSGPARNLPKSKNYLREELIERLSKGPVEYDFAAQFYVNATQTPIETPTLPWEESVTPFRTLARLTLLQQDLRGAAGEKQGAYVESLSFDPWHAPVEFRPLGNIMRARNVIYRHSSIGRGAAKEPEGAAAVVP